MTKQQVKKGVMITKYEQQYKCDRWELLRSNWVLTEGRSEGGTEEAQRSRRWNNKHQISCAKGIAKRAQASRPYESLINFGRGDFPR